MPDQPSFNLGHAVSQWRDELARQPGLTPADLRELEAHLRDGFAELRKLGLSNDEAFLVSSHRVGSPKPVAAEFAKAAPARVWAPRAFWMVFGALVIQVWYSTMALWWSVFLISPAKSVSLGSEADSLFLGLDVLGWLRWAALLLTVGLPIFFAGRWLARGRLDGLARLVSSQYRVAALGVGLLLLAYGLQACALSYWQDQVCSAGNIDPGRAFMMTHYMEMNRDLYFLCSIFLFLLMFLLAPRSTKAKAQTLAA